MVSAPPTLFPEVMERTAPPGRGHHGYYRRANGWVIVASTTPTNRSDEEYKGSTFLPQYGQFLNGSGGGSPKEQDVNGAPWNPAEERWRLIFQKGGAREFPVDQIVAYGWHIRPPYREVSFPQLAGVDVTTIECPECERFFAGTEERDVVQGLRAHLTTRVNPRHSYTVNDLKELGEEWGLDFETARGARKGVRRTVEAPSLTPEPAGPTLSASAEERLVGYACRLGCDWAPLSTSKNPSAAQRMHERSHK